MRDQGGAQRSCAWTSVGGALVIGGTRNRSRSCCIRSSMSKALLIFVTFGGTCGESCLSISGTEHCCGQRWKRTSQYRSCVSSWRPERSCQTRTEASARSNCGHGVAELSFLSLSCCACGIRAGVSSRKTRHSSRQRPYILVGCNFFYDLAVDPLHGPMQRLSTRHQNKYC